MRQKKSALKKIVTVAHMSLFDLKYKTANAGGFGCLFLVWLWDPGGWSGGEFLSLCRCILTVLCWAHCIVIVIQLKSFYNFQIQQDNLCFI